MEPYDTEPVRYGTYAIAYGTCTAMQPHLQLCSLICSYAACYSRQLCDAMQSTLRYTAVMSTPHAVPLRSQATYNTSHLQLQTSALVLQEPIRSAARGAARASRRALGRVHGRLGIPVGVVNYSRPRRRQSTCVCTTVK